MSEYGTLIPSNTLAFDFNSNYQKLYTNSKTGCWLWRRHDLREFFIKYISSNVVCVPRNCLSHRVVLYTNFSHQRAVKTNGHKNIKTFVCFLDPSVRV